MRWDYTKTKLSQAQELYEGARAAHVNLQENIEQWRKQYNGDNKCDELMNGDIAEDFQYVYNISMYLIEGGVKVGVQMPKVTPQYGCEHGYRSARRIENLINLILDNLDTEEIIDEKERTTRICGSCGTNVEWDETIQSQLTHGGINMFPVSPEYIYPQPGCLTEDDCDYIFVKYNTTKEEIARKYELNDEQLSQLATPSNPNDDNATDTDSASMVVMWYKNFDGNVCKYVWSADVELEDNEDFYARQLKKCECCGRLAVECKKSPCEKPRYVTNNLDYDELTEDIKCSDGRVIPAKSPVYEGGKLVTEQKVLPVTDDNGMPVMDVNGMPVTIQVEVPKMKPTRLPYYKPHRFPISIRRNIKSSTSIWGISDMEIIRPQQQAVNKLTCRIMDACMDAGSILFKPEDADITYDNKRGYTVIDVKQSTDRSQFGQFTYTTPIQQYLAERENQIELAKKNVGISDLYTGQSDNTAKSGYAKQLQINQSASRQEPRRVLAEADAARIAQSIFELCLAFADEPRQIYHDDADCETAMSEVFNRYDFYEYDIKTGEWFINDKFTFSIDHAVPPEQLRDQLWQMQNSDFGSGLCGEGIDAIITLWKMRERTGYPNAHLMVEAMKRTKEQIMQAEQMKAQNANAQQGANTAVTEGNKGVNDNA